MSRNTGAIRSQNVLACRIERKSSMTKIKLLSAGLIAAAMLATPAMARENYVAKRHVQEANGENINLEKYPNQDALNGGALTPAGRMGLELPDGAAPVFMGQTMPMRKWAALLPHS